LARNRVLVPFVWLAGPPCAQKRQLCPPVLPVEREQLMERRELEEQLERAERYIRAVDNRYKLLRRRAHLHRSEITGEQADELRRILKGKKVDGAKLVDFEPCDFVDSRGEIDYGRVLWWLDSANDQRWL